MELKNYQKTVMGDLAAYLEAAKGAPTLAAAWERYWRGRDISVGRGGAPEYNDSIEGAPHVCMKVPTGGGKTFLACAAVRRIFDALPPEKSRVVVWLVPSDSILAQTTRALSDVRHPYRQRLDRDFAGRVGVYTKDALLNGQNFSPDTVREMLTVCVLSYGSLRIDSKKKDVRKVFQENGNLLRFAERFQDRAALLAGAPDTALIQVLRSLEPVVVVDESHNAGSKLSVEMLNNLNPSFVLDLTATPRKNSNVISYVNAVELKKEHMVKLPVVVYNRQSRQTVIQDAIQLRASIERQAKAEAAEGGAYVRPIVLFQAQPKLNEESETFDKLRALLVEAGVPERQIAVKTSKVDTLGATNLMAKSCPIRYIITVNALKEGWDCPFAYVLASLANRSSQVDVEQILGRILRQPHARKHERPLLNMSYVLTCSKEFQMTLDGIVKGLNEAGFSRKDYLAPENAGVEATEPVQGELVFPTPEPASQDGEGDDSFTDIDPAALRRTLDALEAGESSPEGGENFALTSMETAAEAAGRAYAATSEQSEGSAFKGGELGGMLHQYAWCEPFREEASRLRVPQFFHRKGWDLFQELDMLEPEHLSEDFSLNGQDAQISFRLAMDDMFTVDLEESGGEGVLKCSRASRMDSEAFRDYLASMPKEKRVAKCASNLVAQLNLNDRYASRELKDYVRRVIGNMRQDELDAMESSLPSYAMEIRRKLDQLEKAQRAETFRLWLDSGRIVCRESYALPEVITPEVAVDRIPKSLYEAEAADMNNYELDVITRIAAMPNVRWWHRVIDRRGFRLNACVNHYPDFMVMTESGMLALVETKGDHLDGENSRLKLKIGRRWQEFAGPRYRYFMVFPTKDLCMEGAYVLDRFLAMLEQM